MAERAHRPEDDEAIAATLRLQEAKERAEAKLDALQDRPSPVDVARVPRADAFRRRAVVDDLLMENAILTMVGEEGDGKSTLAEQIVRQTLRRDHILDQFDSGDLVVSRALLIDTEMDETEQQDRNFDAIRRGLSVEADTFFKLSAGALLLDEESDQRFVEEQIEALNGINLLVIDSVSNALSDKRDDIPVSRFFNWLQDLMRVRDDLYGVLLTMHPRKRGSGDHGRRFDDAFGSREFKGRPGKIVYVDGRRIVAWKDRGGHLQRRWPRTNGARYPQATLNRPGLEDDASPWFTISEESPTTTDEDIVGIETEIMHRLAEHPDHYTKTALATTLGGRKTDALAIINRLISAGRIGPDKPRAKLRVIPGEQGSHQGELT